MLSLFGVTVGLYLIKILSGSRNLLLCLGYWHSMVNWYA